ncbi:MAG TPA: serine hydrolase domain-containing protein [Aquabacterium sp.]|nr:serine hydrolase domain-containing protein [Aquabacterium sp.]
MTRDMSGRQGLPSRRRSPGAFGTLWASLAILCAGCASTGLGSGPAAAGPGAHPLAPLPAGAQQEGLQDRLQRLATRYGICKVTAAVVQDRELRFVTAAQGCAADEALTPDSIFQAASLSKPVFAYAVLKLAQQGKIDLDAPLLQYLPGGYEHRREPHLPDSPADRVSDPRLRAVTARMVLNHTAGLPNWAGGPLHFIGNPGQRWEYSGEGYVLLQRAVEAVTRQDLDEVMGREVFRPIGMTHSAYTSRPELDKHIVAGSTRDGARLEPWSFRAPVSAFTLYTSARDYGLFLAALLKDEVSLRQIVASPVGVDPKLKLGWGLGWGLEADQGDVFLWHWGNNPGYRAFVMASTRLGNGFVMFTNSDNGLTLAEPFGEAAMPGQRSVYRSPLLREGFARLLCETFGVCA